ncbi:992_t:CDS:2 [Entrophospora sp. SA101]|nr:992_t:CDS:2 [Entrophospora sp. SA101]
MNGINEQEFIRIPDYNFTISSSSSYVPRYVPRYRTGAYAIMIALYNGYLIKEAQQYYKKRSTPSIEKGKQLEIIIEIEDILTIKLVFTLETELSIMLAFEQPEIIEIEDTFDYKPCFTLESDSYCTNPNYPMDMESSFNSITNSKPIELAPDYVIERKRLDNLIESIKDGRLGEQKFHLSKSGHNLVDDLEDALKLEIENIK